MPGRTATSEHHTQPILHLRLRPIARLLDPPEVWTPASFQHCSLASFSRLGALLRRCADDVLRAKALELVDPGQRERVGGGSLRVVRVWTASLHGCSREQVDAQLVALTHDLGVGLSS